MRETAPIVAVLLPDGKWHACQEFTIDETTESPLFAGHLLWAGRAARWQEAGGTVRCPVSALVAVRFSSVSASARETDRKRLRRWRHAKKRQKPASETVKRSAETNETVPAMSETLQTDVPIARAASPAQEFLAWFQAEYLTRRHAEYLIQWERDAALVKRMLQAATLPELQDNARILLSDKCDDPFITESDRGIGMLSVRFNWLNGRRAAWELRRKASV